MPYNNETQYDEEAMFNAGISITRSIRYWFNRCDFLRTLQDFPNMLDCLKNIEIAMESKFRPNAKAKAEIEGIHNKYRDEWIFYLHRIGKGRRIPKRIIISSESYISDLQKALTFYSDKFGYGMPSKDNPGMALGRM